MTPSPGTDSGERGRGGKHPPRDRGGTSATLQADQSAYAPSGATQPNDLPAA